MNYKHEQIVAAFVALYDYAFDHARLRIPYGLIELAVYAIRTSIALDRQQAQAILRQPDGHERMDAALVLAYEGIGAHRAEADFTFSYEDVMALGAIRQRARMPLRQAVALLATCQEGKKL